MFEYGIGFYKNKNYRRLIMSITGRRRKMCNPLVIFIVHVLMSTFGLVVGIAAALAFGIKFNNPHAAGWAAVSSIFALILLVVVILVYKKKLRSNWWLTLFALIGATGVVLGSTAFVLYIILGVYDKKSKLVFLSTCHKSCGIGL